MPFKAIEIDPPWEFVTRSAKGKGRSAEKHYGVLSISDLFDLQMQKLFDPDCAVFMWTTWPFLPVALSLGATWGLTYKSCAFNWVKMNRNQNAKPFMGLGYWTRANSEPCLLFTCGHPKRRSASVRQIMIEDEDTLFGELDTETIATPIQGHSQKPDAVRQRIEALVDGPYCEVFARRLRPNWESIGYEIDGRDIREVLASWE